MAGSDYRPEDLVGTGRHLNKSQLRTWTRFLDAGRLMEEMLAQHLTTSHGMTHSDYEVLVRLDGAMGEMRMTTLAGQVVSSAQKLTHTANRLEDRGWIYRRPVEGDGRGLTAVLTETGRAALAEAAIGHAELIKRFLLDVMTAEERKVVAASMDRVSAHCRLHRSKAPCARCGTSEGEGI